MSNESRKYVGKMTELSVIARLWDYFSQLGNIMETWLFLKSKFKKMARERAQWVVCLLCTRLIWVQSHMVSWALLVVIQKSTGRSNLWALLGVAKHGGEENIKNLLLNTLSHFQHVLMKSHTGNFPSILNTKETQDSRFFSKVLSTNYWHIYEAEKWWKLLAYRDK